MLQSKTAKSVRRTMDAPHVLIVFALFVCRGTIKLTVDAYNVILLNLDVTNVATIKLVSRVHLLDIKWKNLLLQLKVKV